MNLRTVRLSALAWAIQPAYLLVEIAIAARATTNGRYAVLADSVSALAVSCEADTGGPCSPWHAGMNTTFAVFGLLVLAGAPLARRADPTARGNVAAALWALAGLSSVAVALAPLDSHPTLHAAVATPVFIAQPLAILLHGLSREGQERAVALGVAALCAAGALAFVLGVGGDDLSGLFERVALWPVKVWLGLVGLRILRSTATRAGAVSPT